MDDVSFDFSFSIFHRLLFVDEIRWSRKGYRLKIEKKDLESAVRNYHVLKKTFLASGHYRLGGDLFYNEMKCRRRLLSLKSVKKNLPSLSSGVKRVCNIPPVKYIVNASFAKRVRGVPVARGVLSRVFCRDRRDLYSKPRRSLVKEFSDWLWMQIFYFTCGFGERPIRVVGLSLATIFFFALAYHLLIPTSIVIAIYLSFDCFVALGTFQGEIIPISYRWLTYLEAGFGVAMISLFLVVFTRKMTRD